MEDAVARADERPEGASRTREGVGRDEGDRREPEDAPDEAGEA